MAKYIEVPFAQLGDTIDVPFKPDGMSIINFQQGFNNIFELDPDAGGEYIKRAWFNYFFKLFTENIQELQRSPIRDYDVNISNNGGYNVGEGCLLNYDIYKRQLLQDTIEYDNTESTYLSKIRVVSLKPNNTTNPYDENALFDSWYVDDGYNIGELRFDSLNDETPPGYIRVNASDIHTSQFSFSIYKRIREKLRDLKDNEKLGIFIKISETNFSIADIRGMFPRIWSNGSSIDSARIFNTIQNPALPNIKGKLYGAKGFAGIFATAGSGSGALRSEDYGGHVYSDSGGTSGQAISINASLVSAVYKDGHNDVTPYNFNVNLFVKV